MEQNIGLYWEKISSMTLEYLPRLGLALVVLWLGLRVIRQLERWMLAAFERNRINKDISPFLTSIITISLKVLLIFSVAGIVGIETTSFVAVLAAAGFAIGIALQGSLGNFAAGIIILVFRPFKVGDLVEVESQTGHVNEVQIFNTIITRLDNRMVIIPNAMAVNGIITNLSARKHLRLDLKVFIPYSEDFSRIESLLQEALRAVPKVLQDPAPFIGIENFDSHFITLTVRPYALTEDYWDVYFESYRQIKHTLGVNGIQMAYSEGVELGPIGG